MSFVKLSTTQNKFLESYLRGTGRAMSSAQANATYGIKNLRARLSEFRKAGLVVRKQLNTEGRTAYSVSGRNVEGSRSRYFV